MVNKPNAILDIEKLLKTQINDFEIGIDDSIICITFESVKFTDKSLNIIVRKLGNLEQLFIFDCELDDASFIDNLPHLKELTIIESKLKSFHVKEMNRDLYSVTLSNNLLQDISFLKYFKNISILNLSHNQITDISILTNFKSFTYLTLNNNDISDISALKNIEINELWIGQNKIYNLSPLYDGLKNNKIEFLNANENPLVYPPMNVVERGENVILTWFELIITEVNKKISENLKSKSIKLDLGNLGITDLSLFTELFNLTHLRELIISNEWAEYDNDKNRWKRIESDNKVLLKNNISEIPKEISKLLNLEKIIIGGDWKSKNDRIYHKWGIVDISSLLPLKKLKFINISNNQVENIEDIVHLQNIEIIHLNNNRIVNVPELSQLKNLKEIYLSNNFISNILFLIHSIHIKTVDLHSNYIENLLPLKDLLQKSPIIIKNSSWEKNCISVSKNRPNINPPYEILNLTKDDFFLYLKQLEYESKLNLKPYYNKEIKVVLVGNSHSGKSTLLNYLKTKRFKKGLASTHWLVTEELKNIKIENEIFKLRFFDFGGQDYYHDTHKMFFSSDSLYLLLWDKKSNSLDKINIQRNNSNEEVQVFPLEYWLDSIKIFAKKSLSQSQKQMEQLLDERDRKINSKVRNKDKGNWISDVFELNESINKITNYQNVLIVQNKIDIEKEFLNQNELLIKYSNIYDFVNISISSKNGLKQFYELYESLIKRNLNYKKPLLTTWGYIKDNFNDVFKDDKFIIDINSFKIRINSYLSIWLKNELAKSDYQISSILFNDEEIVLFANFLKEVGLVIFDSESEILKNKIIVNQNHFLEIVGLILAIAKQNNGFIYKSDLMKISNYKDIVETLIKHNIIFENTSNLNYVAPLFLPENPDFLVNLLVDITIPFRRFKFEGFIPKSIILSVFSNIVNEDISLEDFYFWKYGLIFKNKNGHKILLKFDIGIDLGFAYIEIFNFEKNNNTVFVKEVVEIVKTIIESDCNDYKELVTLDGEYFVEINKLIFNYENDINHIKAYNYKKNVIKHFNIYKYDKFMDDKLRKPKKKLFISYSKQDEALVNNFIEHLSSLQGSGVIDTWYCTELSAGEVWDTKIKEKLDEADIVCFMISPKFMSTPYIHKYEVKQTLKRYHRGDQVQIVPIILDFVDWSKKYTFESELGDEVIWSLDRFTALPFTGKAIKRFKNENMAWYVIEQALKIIIEDNVKSEKDEDYIVRKFSPTVRDIYEDIIANNI